MAQQFDLNKEMARSIGFTPQVVVAPGVVVTAGAGFLPLAEFHTGVLLGQAELPAANPAATAVFILLSAEDAAGTGAIPVAPITFTLTGDVRGSSEIGSIGFNQHDIPYPNHLFVGVICLIDTADTVVSSVILRSDPRYSYDGVADHA